jgi:primosomal protein N' (replication factor Y)
VEVNFSAPKPKKIFKTVNYFELIRDSAWSAEAKKKFLKPASKQITKARELISFLSDKGIKSRNELYDAGFDSITLRKLLIAGVLKLSEKEIERSPEIHYEEEHTELEITDSQKLFVQEVKPHLKSPWGFKPFLLHGITGSGKTQIYIELVKFILPQNKQAIILIPEIILTPQTTARFRNYFTDKVAVIHSKLSPGEKSEIIYKIRKGVYSIVVGPRSAIFSPFKNLGLIIVDEEHESSYKQTDLVPRYNARDVALYRAFLNNIPIVLGSATPSFESLHNALNNKYKYFYLAHRINSRNLPRTRMVDLRGEWHRMGEPPLLSENLVLKTESRLITKEQVMFLQNRRGFSPYLLCKECGYIKKCPNCDITLTYHYPGKNLCCHYCGFMEKAPDVCPQCRGIDILFRGFGTQKIEQYVINEFENAKIQRMDQDTTKGKYGHDKILAKFRRGEVDILIGTKMIAKGLDFKKVSLVGVISADQGLNFPDFRASEKVFQLLTQVSGRAGRGAHSGEVIIQTYDPGHYIFRFLLKNDYLKFYDLEIKTREALNYPPFSRLCLIIRVIGEKEPDVINYSQIIRAYLWKENSEKKFTILGPAPAPLVKLNNQYRYQILLKQNKEIDNTMTAVRKIIKQGLYNNKKTKNWPVKIQIDVDPLEMM